MGPRTSEELHGNLETRHRSELMGRCTRDPLKRTIGKEWPLEMDLGEWDEVSEVQF